MTDRCALDLLAPSPLPFGMPDFRGVSAPVAADAMREGMCLARERWDAIASNPEPPTIANTLEALELSDVELERAEALFSTMVSSIGGEEWDKAEADLVADLVAHDHHYRTHRGLFARLEALRRSLGPDVDPETVFVLDRTIAVFVREGIELDAEASERLRAIDLEISETETAFAQACVDARQAGAYHTRDATGLGIDVAAAGGTVNDGEVSIPQLNYTYHPLLSQIPSPEHRAGLLRASLTRASGGDLDTRPLVTRLAKLRAERARLLGFDTFADLAIDEAVAPSVTAEIDLLTDLARRTQAALAREESPLTELARAEHGEDYTLGPADWRYYEEQLRANSQRFSAEQLRDYLDLDRVIIDGVFYAATCLYGITFVPREDIPAWAPDVRAWEVRDESGETLGLFLGDYYTREHKHGGAWMSALTQACTLTGDMPIVTNNLNLARPAPGEPTLLTWDEVETCFHEFGHALHGLFAASRYPSAAGTNVPVDFVEFPSQLNEMWAYHPQVAARFIRHHATGLPAPTEVIEEVAASKTFGQAFATHEYLTAALIDLAWHHTHADDLPEPDAIDDFETAALTKAGAHHPLIPPRYRSTYFDHTFSGGYASAYASYMWAELMVAGMEEWIKSGPLAGDTKGLNRATGDTLRHEVLSRGYSRDAHDSYRAVTGADPNPTTIATRRGLE